MIATPRGLMIGLPRDYAFALMQRLFPKVDAFTVLEAVQGLSKTHGAAATLTGLVCFAAKLPPLQIALWTLAVPLAFFTLRHLGFFFLPGQLKIPVLYSRFTGFGLVTVVLVAVGLLTVGIVGTVAFFGARIVLEAVTVQVDSRVGKRLGEKLGQLPPLAKLGSMYSAPVKDFAFVYRLYAARVGAPLSADMSVAELNPESWAPVWSDFAAQWPEVVARYPKEES